MKPVLDLALDFCGLDAGVSGGLARSHRQKVPVDGRLEAGGVRRAGGLVGGQRAQESGRDRGGVGGFGDVGVAAAKDPFEQLGLRLGAGHRGDGGAGRVYPVRPARPVRFWRAR